MVVLTAPHGDNATFPLGVGHQRNQALYLLSMLSYALLLHMLSVHDLLGMLSCFFPHGSS